MAYNKDGFQFTHLLQPVYDKLEQTKGLVATGGSTTTIIDTAISSSYQDDELIGFTAFVSYDVGGAGAAPEGEVQRVTDYVASTNTLTTGTFSAAVAAGDHITLARGSLFPLNDVKRLCNNALRTLGDVVNVDTSLTTAASQTEYTVPSTVRYESIVDVQIQTNSDSNDNKYFSVPFNVVPDSTEGAGDAVIVISQPTSGYTIRIISVQPQSRLIAYSDEISKDIHPELAIAACSLACARWKRNAVAELIPIMQDDYLYALRYHPVKKYVKQVHGMPQWYGERSYPGDQSIYDRV